MKLWLQVLFVQGWLWRDRFPGAFAVASTQKRGWQWWVLLLWVPVVWGIAALDQADRAALSALALTNGLVWLVWQCTALLIRPNVGGKESWISLHWAAGLVTYALLSSSVAVGVAAAAWPWVLWSTVLLTCSASHWLRAVQNNYLLFLDPFANRWRLELPSLGKGFVSPVARLVADTYWRLPRQILFPERERHA